MKLKHFILFHMVGLAFTLFLSCEADKPSFIEYSGVEVVTAKGSNLLNAINTAMRQGVQKAVVYLIGESTYRKEKQTLENTILSTQYNKARTYVQSYDTLGQSQKGDENIVTLKVNIDLDKLKLALKELNIPILASNNQINIKTALLDLNSLRNESFLVYYDEKNLKIPVDLAEQAIAKINGYLASKDLEYVDLRQIEQLKKDNEKLLEEQGDLSVTQILANQLHANIYILLDGFLDDGVYKDDLFTSRGTIKLTAFESSTARGLGSEQESSQSKNSNLSESQRQIILKTAIPATERLLSSIVQYKSKPQLYTLTLLGNLDQSARDQLKRTIDQDPKTVSTQLISATENKINYNIQYRGMTHELIQGLFKRLETKEEFDGLKVKLIRRNEIILVTR